LENLLRIGKLKAHAAVPGRTPPGLAKYTKAVYFFHS
jgi:hypothetical protein